VGIRELAANPSDVGQLCAEEITEGLCENHGQFQSSPAVFWVVNLSFKPLPFRINDPMA
jgi:hypothetical protein